MKTAEEGGWNDSSFVFVGDEAFVCLVLCDLCLFESNKKLLE